MSEVKNYPFSFSGTDVEAYIIQGNNYYKLNSLSTVSFQVNEMRNPVRRLGYSIPVGFTKAIRTIAGTLVLTVLKDHPLKELLVSIENTQDETETNCKVRSGSQSILSNKEFDLLLHYQSEGHQEFYSEFKIKGINLISQSLVTSVNDMVTEMIFQFMAKDYEDFVLVDKNEVTRRTVKRKEQEQRAAELLKIVKKVETVSLLVESIETQEDKERAKIYLNSLQTEAQKLEYESFLDNLKSGILK